MNSLVYLGAFLGLLLLAYLMKTKWLIDRSWVVRFVAGFAMGILATFFYRGDVAYNPLSVPWYWRIISGTIFGVFLAFGLREYMRELQGEKPRPIVKYIVLVAAVIMMALLYYVYIVIVRDPGFTGWFGVKGWK